MLKQSNVAANDSNNKGKSTYFKSFLCGIDYFPIIVYLLIYIHIPNPAGLLCVSCSGRYYSHNYFNFIPL